MGRMSAASANAPRLALWTNWNLAKQRPHHLVDVARGAAFRVQVFTVHNFRARGSAPVEPGMVRSVRMLPRQLRALPALTRWDNRRIRRFFERFGAEPADVHIFGGSPFGPAPDGPRCLVYDCIDDWAGFPGADRSVIDHEREICGAAHRIWASSRGLYERLRTRYADKLELVPNGAAVDSFLDVPRIRSERPSARPILGYVGAISPWFDAALVREVARRLNDWELQLVGPVALARAERDLLDAPNIKMLGEQPYERVPDILASFTVGMIPFRLNDLTRATNPCKLYEYLASGLPVVSTALDEVQPFEEPGIVQCAAEPGAFARAVVDLASTEATARRQEIASRYSWEAIFRRALSRVGPLAAPRA